MNCHLKWKLQKILQDNKMIRFYILYYSRKLAKFKRKLVALIDYIKFKIVLKLNSLLLKLKRRRNG